MSDVLQKLRTQLWVFKVLISTRMLVLMSPAKYVRLVRILRQQGTNATTSFALAAVRRPHGTALVDERGSLTWQQLQDRSAALAAGLLATTGEPVETVAILCRNHRGFVDALLANSRLGGSALLLNTGFSGPQLADVMEREGARVILYDEEFAGVVADARDRIDGLVEVLGWTDSPVPAGVLSIEGLIATHAGQVPPRPASAGRVVLLTSGTTGVPKGTAREIKSVLTASDFLDRIPMRANESTFIAAPIFHSVGYSHLTLAMSLGSRAVLHRRFDPCRTLWSVQGQRCTTIVLVPTMLQRIMELDRAVIDSYDLSHLSVVFSSGATLPPDLVHRTQAVGLALCAVSVVCVSLA